MKELSLNILDVAENSVKAGAANIWVLIDETPETLRLTIEDDGCGMTADQVKNVVDPFFTTRTTRKVGLGIPFLKLAAEQTGGEFEITSRAAAEHPESHGTRTTALFYKTSIDFTPLGDVVSSILTLIQGSPDINWRFVHRSGEHEASIDTKELRAVLGEEVPINSYEVMEWIRASLNEEYGLFT